MALITDDLNTVQSSITDWSTTSDTLFGPKSRLKRDTPLCGRTAAQNKLLMSYGNVLKTGSTHAVLVSGPSGSGKSKLVESFRDTITSTKSSVRKGGANVWFVSGKFDQYSGRNDPYSAVITAVTNLIDLITHQDQAKAYEDDVKAAIKDQEIAFATLIPNLGVITNTQYEITSLRPNVTDFRSFKLAFIGLLMALSRRERPLVLFLDDLQWMDDASLDLLATVISSSRRSESSTSNACLMLIGAIRQEDPRTPQVMERLVPSDKEEESNDATTIIPIVQITIGNLDETNVAQMISSAFGMPTTKCISLGHLVHQKTRGNPFAVKSFLELILSDGYMKYDEDYSTWVWDETKIRSETNISDNVLTSVQRVLRRLPQEMKDVLIVASFLGFEFDEDTLVELASFRELGLLYGRANKTDVHRFLVGASYEGIIEVIPSSTTDHQPSRYKFSHDKLQEALYDSLTELESQRLHRAVGLHLRKAAKHSDQAFDIADHLNKARTIVLSSPQERSLVVDSNFEAAKQAISRASYHSAVQYLQLALNAQDSQTKWEEDYELTLEMTASLLDMFSASETATNNNVDIVVDEVIRHARTAADSLQAKCAKVRFVGTECRYVEAIKYGIDVARSIGEKIPKKPNLLQVIAVLSQARRKLARMSDDDVLRLPLVEEKKMKHLLQLYTIVASYATMLGHELLGAYCMIRAASLALTHGIQLTTPLALSHFGLTEFIFKNYENAFRCGRLAVRMIEEIDLGPTAVARVTAVGIGNLLHWEMPCGRDVIDETARGMRIGVIGGEFEFGFFSGTMSLVLELAAGVPLAIVERHGRELCTRMKEYKVQGAAELSGVFWQYCMNLMGLSEYTTVLSGDAMDETTRDPWVRSSKIQEMVFVGMKLQLCRIFGTDRNEEQLAKAFEKDEQAIQMSPVLYDTKFNIALLWYKLARQSVKKKQKLRYLSKAKKVVKYMKKMRKIGCPNFDDILLLLDAEQAWCQGDDEAIVQALYDAAIAAASTKMHHEAFACEQAGLFLESQGDVAQSSSYMAKAITKYREWNAHAKADALETEANGKCLNIGGGAAEITPLYLHLPSTPNVDGTQDNLEKEL